MHISHKITHHAQTKHSTQSYANNKGHITHNEYNAKEKERKSKAVLVSYPLCVKLSQKIK
jgi:hypothetical protein